MSIFIFDIDGTLCKDNSVLTKKNIKILNNLKNKDHKLLFATGRGLEAVKDALLNNESLLDTVIASENGTKIFSSNQLISVSKFSKQELNLISNLIKTNKELIECMDYWINSKLFTYKIPSFVTPIIEDRYRANLGFVDIAKLIKQEPTMLNISFKSIPSLTAYDLNLVLGKKTVQILPFKTSKAKIYDLIDLDSEIYVFGDSNNDLELFQEAKKLNKKAHLVGENKNLIPYATSNIKEIKEVFSYLQDNF